MKKNDSKLSEMGKKKALSAPRLTRIGTLQELTRAKLGMVGDSGIGQTCG